MLFGQTGTACYRHMMKTVGKTQRHFVSFVSLTLGRGASVPLAVETLDVAGLPGGLVLSHAFVHFLSFKRMCIYSIFTISSSIPFRATETL